MLPGTDPDIIARYATLKERSVGRTFGLLEDDIIVLDTETTGLDFDSCELIQVAAARLRGPEVVETFVEFIKPSVPIPEQIVQLTGISDEDVAHARPAGAVVADLVGFIGGLPVVAHNAEFDRKFLEREAQDGWITDFWVDSLALSRIALPRLSSHRLARLADAFDLGKVTHSADDDVASLCDLWRLLLTALSDMPTGFCNRMAHLHANHEWSLRPVFAYLAGEMPNAPFSLGAVRDERIAYDKAPAKADFCELSLVRLPAREQVTAAFGPDGLVGRMYAEYEPRPEQVAMAREVHAAFTTSTHRAIEAGTGVGKSVAYLVPAALTAQEAGITVGVATKTNALMDQLMQKELPGLSAVLEKPLRYCALKGYDHYPCLRKLERFAASADEELITEASLTMTATIYAFACQSSSGDLDCINFTWRHVPRGEVTTTSSECVRRLCPYYPQRCFVHGARRRAEGSDIVVTNHALLFRDVNAEGAILPPIRHWIVDEAHSVEQEARRQWALSISYPDLSGALDMLGTVRGGALGQLVKVAQAEAGGTLLMAAINKAASAASAVSVVAATFFNDIKNLRVLDTSRGGYDTIELWIGANVRASELWGQVSETGGALARRLDELLKLCREVLEIVERDVAAEAGGGAAAGVGTVGGAGAQGASELGGIVTNLQAMHEALLLALAGESEHHVLSAHLDRRETHLVEALVAERLDVGGVFADEWYPELESVVYTSATIAVKDDFRHFDKAVGFDRLDRGAYKNVQLDSSYDYNRQMSVVLAHDLPQPNTPQYLTKMERFLYDVHVGMGGSTLTLFTNRREMEQIYRKIEPLLAAQGLTLACQMRGTSPRQLREQFLEDESTSLFALKSFWEGFDAAGDTLRCVVIPKLPFPNPNNPLSKERGVRDSSSWVHYDLPETVLSVKQAAGRLIRTSTDTGCLILADTRLIQKGYGATFLQSLPKKEHITLGSDEIGDYLRLWNKTRSGH